MTIQLLSPPVPGPVVVTKADGNLNLSIVANTWADIDPNGSAAARPLDIVIPNVVPGQWVEVEPNFYTGSTAAFLYLDCWTIVGGVAVNQFGLGTTGVNGWIIQSNVACMVSGAKSRQLVAGDIENGSVRLRFRSRNSGVTARAIASESTFVASFEGRGPFG